MHIVNGWTIYELDPISKAFDPGPARLHQGGPRAIPEGSFSLLAGGSVRGKCCRGLYNPSGCFYRSGAFFVGVLIRKPYYLPFWVHIKASHIPTVIVITEEVRWLLAARDLAFAG